MFVKMVHPGGHVEIQDRPIQAAEVLRPNPKCCVAQPAVFFRPYAVVSPTTTLVLGQKYYVVPIATIGKLQLMHLSSQSQRANIQSHEQKQKIETKDDDRNKMEYSSCWLIRNNKTCRKSKNGKNLSSKNSSDKKTFSSMKRANIGIGVTRSLSATWQPGLESIIEE